MLSQIDVVMKLVLGDSDDSSIYHDDNSISNHDSNYRNSCDTLLITFLVILWVVWKPLFVQTLRLTL